VYVLLAKAWR